MYCVVFCRNTCAFKGKMKLKCNSISQGHGEFHQRTKINQWRGIHRNRCEYTGRRRSKNVKGHDNAVASQIGSEGIVSY